MSDPRLIGMTKPKLIEEVERLREENEQLREIEIIQEGTHISVTIGGVDALPLCIHRNFGDDMERLRDQNATLLEATSKGGEMLIEQQKRIEELEAILRRLVERRMGDCFEFVVNDAKAVVGPLESNRHIITTEQIRAAWVVLNAASKHSQPLFEDAFKKLGIVRCEGCGGEGSVALNDERILHGPFNSKGKCPECGGEGFKIGEKI